jgi:hypothetical protein
MSETIWVMDSDLCEECGALLDDFCLCPNGCEEELFDEDEDYWDDEEWTTEELQPL